MEKHKAQGSKANPYEYEGASNKIHYKEPTHGYKHDFRVKKKQKDRNVLLKSFSGNSVLILAQVLLFAAIIALAVVYIKRKNVKPPQSTVVPPAPWQKLTTGFQSISPANVDAMALQDTYSIKGTDTMLNMRTIREKEFSREFMNAFQKLEFVTLDLDMDDSASFVDALKSGVVFYQPLYNFLTNTWSLGAVKIVDDSVRLHVFSTSGPEACVDEEFVLLEAIFTKWRFTHLQRLLESKNRNEYLDLINSLLRMKIETPAGMQAEPDSVPIGKSEDSGAAVCIMMHHFNKRQMPPAPTSSKHMRKYVEYIVKSSKEASLQSGITRMFYPFFPNYR